MRLTRTLRQTGRLTLGLLALLLILMPTFSSGAQTSLTKKLPGQYIVVRELVTTIGNDPWTPKPGSKDLPMVWTLKDLGGGKIRLTNVVGSVDGVYTEKGARFRFQIPMGGPIATHTIDVYPSVTGGIYGTQEIVITVFNTVTGLPMGQGREAWKIQGARK